MRGQSPVEFPVPRGGWRTDQPVHQLPPDSLTDGLNTIVDTDGLLKPRLGYQAVTMQVPLFSNESPRIVAGISWQDVGATNLVVATLTRWFVFNSANMTLDDISGGDLLSSDKGTPSRFAQFGFVNDQSALYGVNGALHDTLKRWVVGTPAYASVQPTAPVGLTPIAPFAANDLAVVAGRLVAAGTTEGGIPRPTRVRWSSILDGEMWPPLGYNDLPGSAGNIVGIQLTSRTSAVIYCEAGAWLMTAVPGSDASAFVFDRILNVIKGPLTADAVINVGGRHFYVTNDIHVTTCDGQNAEIISQPIDAGLRSHLVTACLGDVCQRPIGLHDSVRHRLIFFVTLAGDDDSYGAIAYNLVNGAWETPWRFANAISAAFPVFELDGATWNAPGFSASTTLASNISAVQNAIPLVDASQFPDSGFITIRPGTEAIHYDSKTGNTLHVAGTLASFRGMYAPLDPQFAAQAHTAGDKVELDYTWDDAPWPDWNHVPATFQQSIYVGTADGLLARWFALPTDNEANVPWFAQWALRAAPNMVERLQVNTAEVLLVPQVPPPESGETISVELFGLRTPYDDARSTLLGVQLDESDPATWLVRLDPTIADAAFRNANYLLLLMGGASTVQPQIAGAALYAFTIERPDIQGNVTANI